jgi:hypothetical protein
MDLIRDIWAWLVAVFSGWFGGIGFVSTVLWVVAQMRDNPDQGFLNQKWWRVVAVFFLVIASFEAWRDAYVDARPQLLGAIDRVSVAPLEPPDPPGSVVLVVASVKNTGLPSIATDWALTIKNGEEMVATEFALFMQKNFRVHDFEYSAGEALYNRLLRAPLPQGGMERGFLAFKVPGRTPHEVVKPGAIFELRFSDVTGATYRVEWDSAGARPGFSPVAGVDAP